MDNRFVRWIAVSQMPELHAEPMNRHWPENSTTAYWWQTMEDRVLGHLQHLATLQNDARAYEPSL